MTRSPRPAGIEPGYHDIWHNHIVATPDQKRRMLAAMGIDASDAKAQRDSLDALTARRWQRLLEPVTVIAAEAQPGFVTICVAADYSGPVSWTVTEEGGAVHQGKAAIGDLAVVDRAGGPDGDRMLLRLDLPADLPEGYHEVSVAVGDGRADPGGQPADRCPAAVLGAG